MKKQYEKHTTRKNVWSFGYLFGSALSSILLVVMISLPLAPVFADEIETTDIVQEANTAPEVAEVVTADESPVIENLPGEEGVASEEVVAIDTEVTGEATVPSEGAAVEPVVVDDVGENEGSPTDVLDDSQNTNDEEVVATEETPESDLEIISEDIIEEDVPTTTDTENIIEDSSVDDVTIDELATDTTDDVSEDQNDLVEVTQPTTTVGETLSVNTVTNNSNMFSFAENECTTVGDGTFYCTKATSAPEVIHTDRIFAAVDAEGDKEIYVEKDGEIGAITQNAFDDDAPYYDELSNTAVWHRLIEGRYQIILYDFDTENETQLTFDRYNNMQPNRYGDATVWQGWVGNDWEIFLLVGDELTMITDNTTHDIMPSINGTHIVWQSFEQEAWRMKVYDSKTKQINTVGDADGGSIENPRFVLVYDTKFESGDVETRGYDLGSGETISLASEPAPAPKEIPDPDQTGEERALVTVTTQLKPKTGDDQDDDIPEDPQIGGTDDVVVPALGSELATSTDVYETAASSTAATSQDDLILTPFENVTTSETAHIEDVIVAPYISASSSIDGVEPE